MVNTNTRFVDRKKRTMMYNVEDLKSRALVESNILKQFILSANAKKRGEFKPKLDDILIHDYQMANSVTLNVILSNYMVDLAYAVGCMENPLYSGAKDSYFKLVRGLDVTNPNLDDQTRLILDVSDGNGSFKTRDLVLDLNQVWDSNQKVTKFINLDSIWYCKKVLETDEGEKYDTLAIVDEMNNFYKDVNPFGGNPFDMKLYNSSDDDLGYSFNKWISRLQTKELNCIIENRFYKNVMDDDKALNPKDKFGGVITSCRYLLCVHGGFYGLKSHFATTGEFDGFTLYNISDMLPILGNTFNYKFCSFHVIGDKDETTLFLTVVETSTTKHSGKYHYLFLNESSLDETYGFTEIDSVVVDQLVVPPSDVFSWVDQVRELDTVNIAMTDYGFWDIEENNTNNVSYSYRSGKEYSKKVLKFNNDISKLVTPTIDFTSPDDIAIEYSCSGRENYVHDDHGYPIGVDRIWKLITPPWYECAGIQVDGESKRYRDYISPNGIELPFFGGTEHFALYKSRTLADTTDPIQILVNLTVEQFAKLLFANSQLTTYFVKWLYNKVVHSEKGEYYLYNNHFDIASGKRGFIANLRESLENPSSGGNSFDKLEFQLGKPYSSSVELDIQRDKFDSIENLVKKYNSTTSTMTQYCNNLYAIVNADYGSGLGSKKIDVGWLVDNTGDGSGETKIKDTMKTLFSKVTWHQTKLATFVDGALDSLIGEFPLLRYFHEYLNQNLTNYLKVFDTDHALAQDPITDFAIVDGVNEANRVVGAVQDYIKDKVSTSLVLGGYREQDEHGRPLSGNDRYPGIEQYIFQNKRKLNKVQVRDIMSMTKTLKEAMFAVQSTKFVNGCDSYASLQLAVLDGDSDRDLFTMTQNEKFVELSRLVLPTALDALNVNWSEVKTWMFSGDNCSDENMLKAFVRTQVYRPLFFEYNNYHNFSNNESAYSCTTTKWFNDHEGNPPRQIVFKTDPWWDSPEVDKNASGLDDTGKPYTIDRISFYKISNKFEYFINYDPVKIVDNKFVVDDVEFYVVRHKENDNPSGLAVNSIYFNEFQNNTEG